MNVGQVCKFPSSMVSNGVPTVGTSGVFIGVDEDGSNSMDFRTHESLYIYYIMVVELKTLRKFNRNKFRTPMITYTRMYNV